jgi:hypothetical protein
MAYAPTTVVSRAPGAVFRELSAGEGAVVLNLDSGQYHGVNSVGVLIWELLERSPTFAELVTAVRRQVTDAPDALDDDITTFVEALEHRGLVHVATKDDPGAA